MSMECRGQNTGTRACRRHQDLRKARGAFPLGVHRRNQPRTSTVDFRLPELTEDKSALLDDPVFADICYHSRRERTRGPPD